MPSDTVQFSEPVRLEDDLELDARAYELRRSGRRLKLERIPMELLLLLVEHRGELVSREQIVERVWGKDVHLATDSSINAAVRKIRRVLKDDPGRPRFIQTISGKGYRFIAPVEDARALSTQLTNAPAGVAAASAASDIIPASPISHTGTRRWQLLLSIVVILVAASSTYFFGFRSRSSVPPTDPRLMLAVLPFENLTGDPAQDYFSDGLTEEMISQLGILDPTHLGVIARTSVMRYKNNQEQLGQIGRELGVQYVLEGSVRRDAKKVRVSAQLIQMSDQTPLWTRQYDRELRTLLGLQDEITHEIADEIHLTLGKDRRTRAAGQPRISESYEAHDLYLKGRYFWNKRTPEGFREAIKYFQQATEKDPSYARAYAGLADCYVLLPEYSEIPQAEFMAKARVAALKALQLDEGLAEAHTSLALITENYDWDWQTAEKEYRRAIELNPNYATAHHWYAEYLTWLGRFDEALRESERARRLDPLSLIIASDNGTIFYFSRQYDRAEETFNAVLEMEPAFPRAHMVRLVYAEKGQFANALADVEKYSPHSTPWDLAYLLGRSGHAAAAQRALEEVLTRRPPVDPAAIAWSYIGMGNKEQALAWLEKAYAQHSNGMVTLKVEPGWDPLRSDPRFQDLLRRVGLAQ